MVDGDEFSDTEIRDNILSLPKGGTGVNSQYLTDLRQAASSIEGAWHQHHWRHQQDIADLKENCDGGICQAYQFCHIQVMGIIRIYEKV